MDKHAILQRYFGYTEFRSGQSELIDAILSGRDAFGIMPTGGGKSLCYQVPAMLLPGITVVVSPLISLMQDQVLALKSVGIPAAYINSSLTYPQIQTVYRNLFAGQYKIVYIAPERLDFGNFSNFISRLNISLLAVDEAHCISQWGQDFRPSYLRILNFISSLPVRPIVGAFTATATQQVRQDVERILQLNDPVRTITGFDRPNLSFDVLHPKKKEDTLIKLLSQRKQKSGIIYCSTRKKVESVCEMLIEQGFHATRYHAGLEDTERTTNQEDFIHDRKTIMVATNAFGMGIDKSNVSFVLHYNMPKSIEGYYQEAGRAGRDGSDAECILLFSGSDIQTAKFLINNSAENEELDPEQRELVRQQDMERLEAMIGYCKTNSCLRGFILNYFGQKHPEICGNCGNCRGQFDTVDITQEAQMILSCVKRVQDKVGKPVSITTVTRVLQGSRDLNLLQSELHTLSTFGLMKTVGSSKIREIADRLEAEGYLHTDETTRTLRLAYSASEILFLGKNITMFVRKEQDTAPPVSSTVTLSGQNAELYELLRELRGKLAREANIPAYVVFSNTTLEDMVRKKPTTLSAFRKVSGVGELKCAWYGKEFTACIREYLSGEHR